MVRCRNAVYSHCAISHGRLQKRMWNIYIIIISALSKDGSNISFLLLFYWRFFAVRRATMLKKRHRLQDVEADQTCTMVTATAAKSGGTPSRACILPLPH